MSDQTTTDLSVLLGQLAAGDPAARDEILVKSQTPVESVKAGQTVSIMGSVRPMPQDPSKHA